MLPQQFSDRMNLLLGEEYKDFLASYEKEYARALRLNKGKAHRDSFLSEPPFALTPVPWSSDGFYYEAADQPGKHPYHEAGVYYIQEPSAMVPARLLGAEPGERILDLCAAPGGKSTQIAADMKGEGILVCNEIHPARAKILSENVERMGVVNALVTNETPGKLAEHFPEYFDRILVDAPCSGEGMFRKNAEACSEWSTENVELCAARQDGILDAAAEQLRPGGRLVYSTCTFEPLENEGSVSRFLARHPEFSLKEAEKLPGMSDGVEAWAEASRAKTGGRSGPWGLERTLRLWPHRIRGEGHFAAVFQKEGGIQRRENPYPPNGLQRAVPEKECGEYLKFREEFLKTVLSGSYLRFGEQLYLAPPQTPALEGLKVLRPGLHLGTEKKGRFVPAHALALALSPRDVSLFRNRRVGGEIENYLTGQTFPAQGDKGWYLITVDGYSAGWGKLAGGIMKNHYPRGLRRQA